MALVVAMALSVPRAHAAITSSFERDGGDARDAAGVPAPQRSPPGGGGGRSECGGTCTAWSLRAMYDLTTLCHERSWVLAPVDGDRYVVATGTSAAAADQDEEERDRKGEREG